MTASDAKVSVSLKLNVARGRAHSLYRFSVEHAAALSWLEAMTLHKTIAATSCGVMDSTRAHRMPHVSALLPPQHELRGGEGAQGRREGGRRRGSGPAGRGATHVDRRDAQVDTQPHVAALLLGSLIIFDSMGHYLAWLCLMEVQSTSSVSVSHRQCLALACCAGCPGTSSRRRCNQAAT